jgi:hypothetical protein
MSYNTWLSSILSLQTARYNHHDSYSSKNERNKDNTLQLFTTGIGVDLFHAPDFFN